MDEKTITVHGSAVVATLDGVTTVLVAFLFVCLVFPSIVRHKQQFYGALAAVVGILLLHTLGLIVVESDKLGLPVAVFTGLLQIVALLLLVLCVGGLTTRQLAGDMSRAYEVMRRGETTKETIIPIGEQARTRAEPAGTVYHVDSGPTPGRKPVVDDDDDDAHGIPLT